MIGNLFRPLFCLLAFFIAFMKYGEANVKFMSISGDVNLAMMEQTVSRTDKVGFLFDDMDGGYIVNLDFCLNHKDGREVFYPQSDCTVLAGKDYVKKPNYYLDYAVVHRFRFPERKTGANFIVGSRDGRSPYTAEVTREGTAVNFIGVTDPAYKKYSKIYCNDKNYDHYGQLFKFGKRNQDTILFRKDDRSEYEQTMKCIVILKNKVDKLISARLFTLIISGLESRPFSFRASRNLDRTKLQFATQSSRNYRRTVTNIMNKGAETNFVFRPDATHACPPTISLERTEQKHKSIYIKYNGNVFYMPAILDDGPINCGIESIPSGYNNEPLLKYSCECRGRFRYLGQ